MTFCAGFVANFFSIVAIREGFVAIFYSIVATCPGLVAICAGSVAILRGCPLLLVDSTYDHEHLAPETGQQREPMLTYRTNFQGRQVKTATSCVNTCITNILLAEVC